MALMQASIVSLIEIINIINLRSIDNMKDLVFDFVALGCIFEFDDAFAEAWRATRLSFFFDLELPNNMYRKEKVMYVEKSCQEDINTKFWKLVPSMSWRTSIWSRGRTAEMT